MVMEWCKRVTILSTQLCETVNWAWFPLPPPPPTPPPPPPPSRPLQALIKECIKQLSTFMYSALSIASVVGTVGTCWQEIDQEINVMDPSGSSL